MIFVILGSALLIGALCGAFFTYRICFHSPKKRRGDAFDPVPGAQFDAVQDVMFGSMRIMERTQCEYLKMTAHDGKQLSARYYESAPGAPLILAFHGYRGFALRDSAGAFCLGLKLGYNVLAVDQRSHGDSEGRVITFGVEERLDCLDWTKFANEHFGMRPMILYGLSMGAATVLMASELELPDNVCCIVADCPYSSPAAIIKKVAKDLHYPAGLAYPFIRMGAALFGGFNLNKCAAVTAVQKAKVPILLLHGEDDWFVPCDMSKEIYKSCAPGAQLHTFPGAGHGLSYIIDFKRYEEICINFFKTVPALAVHV